jgi:uncharacterized iron-regulated membrane protein
LKKRTKKIFYIHHWCGLMAGMFLLAMSLSGSVLVFHDEIDHAFFRNEILLQEHGQRLSFDRSFEHIRKNNPGWEIRIPARPDDRQALKYELRKGNLRKWIFVHPEKGHVLATIDRADRRLVNVLLTFHYSLFGGTPGKIFVTIIGVAFLALLVTGVILYRKSLVKVFLFRHRFSLKSRRAFFSSAHRLIGVWGLALNVLICITGIRIAYVVTSAAINATESPISVPVITHSIDALVSKAQAAHPEFRVRYLRFPSTDEGKLLLLGHLGSDPSYYGRTYSNIAINYQSGDVEGISLLRDKPFSERFLIILQPLHFGDYAGIWVKLIYAIGGLLPGVLALSGFLIWRYQHRKSRPIQRNVLLMQKQ